MRSNKIEKSESRIAKGETKRLSTSVPEETADAVDAFAAHKNVSKSQATKLLIERGLNIELMTEDGGEILYRAPDGETSVIYRPGVDHIDDPQRILDDS